MILYLPMLMLMVVRYEKSKLNQSPSYMTPRGKIMAIKQVTVKKAEGELFDLDESNLQQISMMV